MPRWLDVLLGADYRASHFIASEVSSKTRRLYPRLSATVSRNLYRDRASSLSTIAAFLSTCQFLTREKHDVTSLNVSHVFSLPPIARTSTTTRQVLFCRQASMICSVIFISVLKVRSPSALICRISSCFSIVSLKDTSACSS